MEQQNIHIFFLCAISFLIGIFSGLYLLNGKHVSSFFSSDLKNSSPNNTLSKSFNNNELRTTLKKSEKRDCKMVLCIRTDLGMTKGKVAAQCSHATLAAYQQAMDKSPQYVDTWEARGQAKITLKIQNDSVMNSLYKKARESGLTAVIIRDAGKTQIQAGSKTVLAVGPGPVEEIDKVTGHLSLY